ncbi:hypothetical protein DID88_000410 [Monilinia fructigena]|uniref:Uncharacterized protein n=1 Tax=Monilinia fructigena TaxID=38457 RepID=A0A395IHX0_9HELO|nr:hypothetical protein DID88_000410 [Monilinia fructigena]
MVRNWRNNSVVDGVVLAFFTMCFQYIIALPIKNQSFTLKFYYHSETRENKDGQIRCSNEIHRLPLGNEAHRQTSEDLV